MTERETKLKCELESLTAEIDLLSPRADESTPASKARAMAQLGAAKALTKDLLLQFGTFNEAELDTVARSISLARSAVDAAKVQLGV